MFQQFIEEDRLTGIKGIGKDLAAKIAELVTTGKLKAHTDLKASLPPGLLEMLRIPGFGPKRARVVYDQLKVDSIASAARRARSASILRPVAQPPDIGLGQPAILEHFLGP